MFATLPTPEVARLYAERGEDLGDQCLRVLEDEIDGVGRIRNAKHPPGLLAILSPLRQDGETERISPIVLPVMRGMHLLSMLAIGCASIALVISGWAAVIPGVSLTTLFIRNALFLTGCVLLIGRVVDVRLSWLVPILLGGVTIVGVVQRMVRIERVEELWQGSSWNILPLDETYGVANAICLGIGLAGIAVYIRDGVRDTDEAQ